MKNWLKNKGVGYYIAAGVAAVALIFLVIFLITYKGQMGNMEGALVPETIIAFLIAGIVVEGVVLVLPRFRFVQIIAVAMFGMALYKDVMIIPDFIAGIANGVEYNGGNTPLNIFYFIALFLIAVAAIVPAFLGFYKDAKDPEDNFKVDTKNSGQMVKVCASGVLVVAAVLASSLVSANLEKGHKATSGSSEKGEKVDPITDEIRQAAEAYDYDFDPTSVIIKENNETYYTEGSGWNFSHADLSSLPTTGTREGHNMVYYFEGTYSEGYQGDYSPTYGEMWLWEDGLFAAKISDRTIKGFWYNSSLDKGQDEAGNDIVDCLNMVTNTDRYQSIITKASTGFYSRTAYTYCHMSWNGDRSMIMNGYYYYPEVALFIDKGNAPAKYAVGDTFNRGTWVAKRVLKNLAYSAVFKKENVKWTDEPGMLDSDGKFTAAGEYTVTASWNGFEATTTVVVE